MSLSLFELFKIGIGPSSSHTVGPMVAAKSFVDLLEVNQQLPQVHRVRIDLFGSLALTGLGHATDRAVLLGLTGEIPQIVEPDRAEHLFHAVSQSSRLWLNGKHEIAFELKTDLCFNFQTFLLEHSNGMGFKAYDAAGIVLLEKTYFSIGGGLVRAREEMHAKDPNLKAPDSKAAIPFPFANAAQLEQQCLENDLTIAQVMRANESALDPSRDIDASLQAIWDAMHRAIELGCGTPGLLPGPQKLRRRAPELYRELRSHAKRNVADQFEMMDWVSLYAMAVNEQNAAGGRVVTAPTNGAAGVIPAVLNYFLQFSPAATDEGVAEFLLTAGAIGLLYQRNASISAAEVGCQGEIGVACSMAAAGLCAVLGGSVAQIENAAEIGMEHNLGLTCDPVGGLVQVPCIERNTMGAVKAINAARLALRGDGEHLVSLDSVISTMLQTGRDMQTNYKETSLGGLAVNVVAC